MFIQLLKYVNALEQNRQLTLAINSPSTIGLRQCLHCHLQRIKPKVSALLFATTVPHIMHINKQLLYGTTFVFEEHHNSCEAVAVQPAELTDLSDTSPAGTIIVWQTDGLVKGSRMKGSGVFYSILLALK